MMILIWMPFVWTPVVQNIRHCYEFMDFNFNSCKHEEFSRHSIEGFSISYNEYNFYDFSGAKMMNNDYQPNEIHFDFIKSQ